MAPYIQKDDTDREEITATSVVMRWDKPKDDGGTNVTAYRLYANKVRRTLSVSVFIGPFLLDLLSACLPVAFCLPLPLWRQGRCIDDEDDGPRDIKDLLGGKGPWLCMIETNQHGRGGKIEGLEPHFEYRFRVCAVNRKGEGDRSPHSDVVVCPNKAEYMLGQKASPKARRKRR